MENAQKHSIELESGEYDALVQNPIIQSFCEHLLEAPRKSGSFLVLQLTEAELEELTECVAAEANHAETPEKEEVLDDVCDHLEALLIGIRRKRNR